MERIYLTKSQKELIRKILSNNNIYCNVRQEDYNDLTILEEKKIVDNKGNEGGGIIYSHLTKYGESYIISNPKLKNPSIWDDKKYWINTATSVLALIVAIIALFKK